MIRIGLTMVVVFVAGCANFEPYHRSDVWYPTGSNAGNIAAMAADPNDLILGRSGKEGDAPQAGAAIDRVLDGRAKPLGITSSTSAPAAAAAGPGAQNQ
jgi:type IV pilus biogenesis protein CpaD/CtpE